MPLKEIFSKTPLPSFPSTVSGTVGALGTAFPIVSSRKIDDYIVNEKGKEDTYRKGIEDAVPAASTVPGSETIDKKRDNAVPTVPDSETIDKKRDNAVPTVPETAERDR